MVVGVGRLCRLGVEVEEAQVDEAHHRQREVALRPRPPSARTHARGCAVRLESPCGRRRRPVRRESGPAVFESVIADHIAARDVISDESDPALRALHLKPGPLSPTVISDQ